MNTKADSEKLELWLPLAVRRARIAFRDGRRADDARAEKHGHTRGGLRLNWAFQQAERVALDLTDAVFEKAEESRAPIASIDRAAGEAFGLFSEMAMEVRALTAFVAPDSPDAQHQVDELLSRLHGDLAGAFRLLQKEAPSPPTERKARVTDKRLQDWLTGYADEHDLQSLDVDKEIVPAAEAFFEGKIVGRQRVRDFVEEIAGPQKRGKKPFRRKETAE